jgi:hypothetical protein
MNLIETIRAMKERSITHPDSEDATVLLDFDGVLSESSGPFQRGHFGPPVPEGLKLLRLCLQHKYKVVIFTARKETDLVANWLRDQGFPHMYVTNHKIPASSYVDDRAIPWSTKKSKADDAIKFVRNPRATLGLHV